MLVSEQNLEREISEKKKRMWLNRLTLRTVTSFPSTVNVISALRTEEDAKERRPAISVNNMNMIWKQAPPTHTSVCSLSENSRRGRPRHSGDYAQHLSLCCCREGDDGGRKETMVRKQYVTGEIRDC